MEEGGPATFAGLKWRVADASDKVNLYLCNDRGVQKLDMRNILTRTIDLVYQQMIGFTMFLGLGFAVLALNDVIDQSVPNMYSNVTLLNIKTCTAIVLFSGFLTVFHSLISRMNELQDDVIPQEPKGLDSYNRVKCRTTMKVEPFQIATIIATEQKGWRISKPEGISRAFVAGDTFYVKQTGSETFYAITLTEAGAKNGFVRVEKYFLTQSTADLNNQNEVKEFLILRNYIHQVANPFHGRDLGTGTASAPVPFTTSVAPAMNGKINVAPQTDGGMIEMGQIVPKMQ